MNWEKPAWYLTPQEFADIIVESLEDNNYFKRNEKAHPVDIEAAFSATASAVATAIDHIGKKMYAQEKKAFLQAGNLKKNVAPTVDVTYSSNSVEDGADDYFEQKYGKISK